MKNYKPEQDINDVEQNEEPISYEDPEDINRYVINSTNRPVITQSPARGGNAAPSKSGFNLNNHSNFQPVSSNSNINLMSKHNMQQQQQQRQQNQYYDPRGEPPIYVPPFLVNNNARQSRHHPHFNSPQDYLPWSIANIFICVIIALPALFFSVQTRDLKRMGNIKKAKMNSRRSLILNIVASVIGLFTIVTALILRFALYQLFVQNDVRSQNVPLIAGG